MRRSGLPTVVLRGLGLAGGVALEGVASLEFELFESPLSTDTLLRDGGGRAQEDKEQDSEDERTNKKFQHCAASGGECTE